MDTTPLPPGTDQQPHVMRVFLAHAVALVLVLGIANAASWKWEQANGYLIREQQTIEKAPHEVVIVGNSLADLHLNDKVLAAASGWQVAEIHRGGSSSGWWYLAIKNVVLKVNPLPKVILVPFLPTYVANSAGYIEAYSKDPIALRHEPEIERLRVQYGGGVQITRWLSTFAVIRGSEQLHDMFYEKIRDQVAIAAGIGKKDPSVVMNAELKNIDSKRARIFGSSSVKKERGTVEESFIPLMVDVAKEKRVTIIFIRVRERDMEEELPADIAFTDTMKEYLARRGVPYFDYSEDARIVPADFSDDKHLKKAAQEKFADILTDDIAPYLK